LRPKIIPVFIPHLGCVNDCIYCDQKKITGIEHKISNRKIRKTIDLYLLKIFSDYPNISSRNIQIAFYGGNFTGLDISHQESLLEISKSYVERGSVGSVRISTRPDFLDQKKLIFLKERYVKTIEIGVQSLDDSVLAISGRNYSSRVVYDSFNLLRDNHFQIGIQIMLGLPGDTFESLKSTIKKIINWKPDFVRLYPTLVIKGTPLEKLYKERKYNPMNLDEVISLCKIILLNLEINNIPVIRLGLHPSFSLLDKIIDGPFHPSLKYLVKSEIDYDLMNLIFRKYKREVCNSVIFYIPEKSLSEFRGFKRKNILRIKERFKINNIDFVEKKEIKQGNLIASFDNKEIKMSQKDLMYQNDYSL